MVTIIGWDIGGANIKAAWLAYEHGIAREVRAASLPFEIWRHKDRLPEVLKEAFAQVTTEVPQAMALTMTAELADVFSTKREGVLFVMDRMLTAFPDCASSALSLSGDFYPLVEAMKQPLDFAASNWLATGMHLGRQHPDSLLVDVGSTTTDIIPVLGGKLAAKGYTDLDRLKTGELVYTGALRTHLAAIVHQVPVSGQLCPVSSEYFAISGDVHLILGHITPDEYNCPTPDGRPPSIESARRRLARLVCADMDMLTVAEIGEMAGYIYEQQLEQIRRALQQVLSRLPQLRALPLITMGSGAFLANEAARRAGLAAQELGTEWGRKVSEVAPCVAVAHLLAARLERP